MFVLIEFVDNRPFARTGRLKEADLATWLKRDDLAEVGSADRSVADEMRSAFLDNITARAQAGRQKKARITRLEFEGRPDLRAESTPFQPSLESLPNRQICGHRLIERPPGVRPLPESGHLPAQNIRLPRVRRQSPSQC